MSNIKTPKLNNELVSFVVGVLLGFFICLFTFPKFMDSTLYWTLVVLWGVLFPGYYYINYFLFKRKNQWMQLFVFAFMALIFCISIYSVLQDNVDIQANLNLFLILMFTMVFNMTVVFHYDFEESVVALGALLDKVIFIACGAAFGVGFRLFLTYFWGETDPPQESLSLERKVFYGIKTTYYFFLTLSGAFIWRRKKALKKVSKRLFFHRAKGVDCHRDKFYYYLCGVIGHCYENQA